MQKRLLNLEVLKRLMRFRPILKDCACFFDCSEDTITRFVFKNTQLSFSDFRDLYLGTTRLKLQRKALDLALGGDKSMLIFCLKNMSGWKENPDIYIDQEDVTLDIEVTCRDTTKSSSSF